MNRVGPKSNDWFFKRIKNWNIEKERTQKNESHVIAERVWSEAATGQ